METASIIYAIAISVILIMSVIKGFLQDKLISLYKKQIDHLEVGTDSLLEFCLVEVIRISIEKEDYEMADKCNKNLIQLRELSKNKKP